MSSPSPTGGEPQAKRQRTDGGAGLIEDETTAREKLVQAKFDPDDVVSAIHPPSSVKPQGVGSWYSITPMVHFCYHGDLPMCRYILSRGGSTTKNSNEFWFPMYAAVHRGHLDICKWLYENGAQQDVRRGTSRGSSGHRPLSNCWRTPNDKYLEVAKWLLLHGACHSGDDLTEDLDATLVQRDLRPRRQRQEVFTIMWRDLRPEILSWSEDALQARDLFHVFLMGTFMPPPAMDSKPPAKSDRHNGKNTQQSTPRSPVQCLCGISGVLKNIAEFVGVLTDLVELGIHRQLADLLPRILTEEPPREDGDTDALAI